MTKIYYIGGSPCSGKSSAAEILCRDYGLCYFKADDYLEKYVKQGSEHGAKICLKQLEMDPEQIWMRSADIQAAEELEFYRETFEFAVEDLNQIGSGREILAEGAAFLPELMRQAGISAEEYIAVTPTGEFQVSHYRQREWISYVLSGCSDKEKAFDNWMNRDILFAEEVRKQCEELGYTHILVDGTAGLNETVKMIAEHFGLNEK